MNDRQRAFVREYLVDHNGKHAAIRAGYSPKSAEATASTLLKNPAVESELAKQRAVQINRLELKADEVLNEVRAIAFAALEKGSLIRAKEKIRALELLMRHLGLLEPQAAGDLHIHAYLTPQVLARMPQDQLDELGELALRVRQVLDRMAQMPAPKRVKRITGGGA